MSVETKKHKHDDAAQAFKEIVGALAHRHKEDQALNIKIVEEYMTPGEHPAQPVKMDSRDAKPK
jgi:hypothetical protein